MRSLYASLRTFLEMYVDIHRHSGRTSKVVAEARDGDWIITEHSEEAHRIERELRRAGKHKVRVSGVSSMWHLMNAADRRGVMDPGGRVLFDHLAIEQFYRAALTEVERSMDAFERAVTRGEDPTRPPGDIELPMRIAERVRRGIGGEWKA